MSAEDKRLVALRSWAAQARSDGWDVPDDASLAMIATAGTADGTPDPVVTAWSPTIVALLHQVRFGVNDPHLQLEERLTRPSSPPPATAPAPPAAAVPESASSSAASGSTRAARGSGQPEDGLLAHLRADQRVTAISGLKDVHLKLIVKSNRRTTDEISTFLPIGPDAQAGTIADSIAAFRGDVRVPATPRPQTPPPAAPPRPASQQPPSAPGPSSSGDGSVPPDGFADFEYGAGAGPVHEVVLTRTTDGAVRAVWPGQDARAVYRLVAEDASSPYSPDESRLVAATTATTAVDGEPIEHAVRHYQVWRNEGPSLEAAKRAQPSLHAEGALVAPVVGADIRDEPGGAARPGRVVGQWRALPGTDSVHIYRVPRRSAAQSVGDPRYRLSPGERHLTGFVDDDAEPGEYVYQVIAEADVDGTAMLSRPHVKPVTIAPHLAAVRDLRVDASGVGFVDLTWSPPAGGRVVVYRTREAPAAGVDQRPVSEGLLAEQGALALSDRLAHPVETGSDGTESMTGVLWPAGWTRAFFTPVVIVGDRALVGPTARHANVPPPARVTLVERVQRQLLTFAWPEGADVVQVYRSETGASSADALHGTPAELSWEEYRDRGGFELRDLPARGCDLHLVATLFDEGVRRLSQPVRAHYDGILRLRYSCAVKRPLFGQKGVFVSITAEFVPGSPPPFVLVHNPERLPLSKFDGTRLAMVREGDDPGPPSVQFRPRSLGRPDDAVQAWRTDDAVWKRIAGAPGFVRLFVEVPTDKARLVALLDPPLASLRLGGKGATGG